jgi:hypothetical protein
MDTGHPPSVEARVRLVSAVAATVVPSGMVVATAGRDQTHSFLRRGRSNPMPVVESSAIAAKEEIT